MAPLDHFHGRGLVATQELAAILHPQPGQRLLDIGSGIGGPARWIAATFGVHVTGVDLTPEFCAAAEDLNRAAGLADRVRIVNGSALELPVPDGAFDAAYSQNVIMNIADKPRFYREAFRALRPGGVLALANVCAGPGGEPYYPQMWAATAATSFLATPDDTRRAVAEAGFAIVSFRDTTAELLPAQPRSGAPSERGAQPGLGIHVLMGGGRARGAEKLGAKPSGGPDRDNQMLLLQEMSRAMSGCRDDKASYLSLIAPDNGGSDITGYNIYRSDALHLEALIGQQTNPADTTFNDRNVDSTVTTYAYRITALNGLGEGTVSNTVSLPLGVCLKSTGSCLLPGVTTIVDPAGDETDAQPAHDITSVSMAEPITPRSHGHGQGQQRGGDDQGGDSCNDSARLAMVHSFRRDQERCSPDGTTVWHPGRYIGYRLLCLDGVRWDGPGWR